MTRPVVIGFVGRSGSGKTTLLERLVAIFRARGLRVAVLKDAHHGFSMDKPGKDSWRYREAGAETVVVRSDARWVVLHETPAGRAGVEELLSHVGDVDLVLVEGFKNEGDYPKYESFAPTRRPRGRSFPAPFLRASSRTSRPRRSAPTFPFCRSTNPSAWRPICSRRIFAAKISGEFLFGKGLRPGAKERR